MPKIRKPKQRRVKKRILILCEGKVTEPKYFRGIKQSDEYKYSQSIVEIEVYDSDKSTGRELVKEAKKEKNSARREKNPFNEIWVVIDKDGYTKHPECFDEAKASSILIAFSSISFEYWFLLHLKYTTKAFEKADDLIADLNKELEKLGMPKYKKNDDNFLKFQSRISSAIKNAKLVKSYNQVFLERGEKLHTLNPYTNVDEIVEQLIRN